MIEVPAVSDGSSRSKPRRLLNEVLQARAEEAFGLVRQELRRAGVEGRLIAGVVLTGALACMAGSCDIAEKVLDATTRIGLPPRLEYMPDELDDPSWATAAGLALYAQRLRLHRQRRRDRMTEWLKTILE